MRNNNEMNEDFAFGLLCTFPQLLELYRTVLPLLLRDKGGISCMIQLEFLITKVIVLHFVFQLVNA